MSLLNPTAPATPPPSDAPPANPPANPPVTPPAAPPAGYGWLADDKGTFDPGFSARLPEHLRPIASKYQSLPAFIEAAHGLEQRFGGKPFAIIPGPDADEQTRAAWRKANGVPDAPEGYGFAKPEDYPAELQWNDEVMAGYAKLMHEHGVPPEAAKALVAARVAEDKANLARIKEAESAEEARQLTVLQEKWGQGAAFDAKLAEAQNGVRMLGIDFATWDSPLANNAEFLQLMAGLGKSFREPDLKTGAAPAGRAHSDAEEARRIQTDPNHPDHKRYVAGDDAIHQKVLMLNRSAK